VIGRVEPHISSALWCLYVFYHVILLRDAHLDAGVRYDAARLKLQGVRGNKALLLLTDGFDTGSVRTWSEAASAAQKADTAVYAIQYRSASGGSYTPQLYRLVAETAGTWFSAPAGDLGPIVARLETDLRERYVVGFRPEKARMRP